MVHNPILLLQRVARSGDVARAAGASVVLVVVARAVRC